MVGLFIIIIQSERKVWFPPKASDGGIFNRNLYLTWIMTWIHVKLKLVPPCYYFTKFQNVLFASRKILFATLACANLLSHWTSQSQLCCYNLLISMYKQHMASDRTWCISYLLCHWWYSVWRWLGEGDNSTAPPLWSSSVLRCPSESSSTGWRLWPSDQTRKAASCDHLNTHIHTPHLLLCSDRITSRSGQSEHWSPVMKSWVSALLVR